jgi:hypothetical protein
VGLCGLVEHTRGEGERLMHACPFQRRVFLSRIRTIFAAGWAMGPGQANVPSQVVRA